MTSWQAWAKGDQTYAGKKEKGDVDNWVSAGRVTGKGQGGSKSNFKKQGRKEESRSQQKKKKKKSEKPEKKGSSGNASER